MTDNLKCPFCVAELFPVLDESGNGLYEMFVCTNPKCKYYGCRYHSDILQAIIDGKKAQEALIEAVKCINWTIDTIVKGLDRELDIVGCCELSLERINEITKQEA